MSPPDDFRGNRTSGEAYDRDATSWVPLLQAFMQSLAQGIGLLLVLLGTYFCVSSFFYVVGTLRDPEKLEPSVKAMSQMLELDGTEIVVGESKIPLGRAVGLVATGVGTVISVWIAIALLYAGGRLVWGPISERREFYAAMKEFSREINRESRRTG